MRDAACCWVPHEELQTFLNALPGQKLTVTDIAQRLRAIHEEPYGSYPDEALRDECLKLFEREKLLGTELPAIVGAINEFVEEESDRRRESALMAWRLRQAEEKAALEARFLAGADCKWTPVNDSKDVFTRWNGRAYRLTPTREKRWTLFRIADNHDAGVQLGTYATLGDANKALMNLAYEPEPRW